VEAPRVAAGVERADRKAEGVAPGHLLRHRDELVAARRRLRLAVGAGDAGLLHHLHVEVEHVLRHVERQRIALALKRSALPRRRQILLTTKSLAARRRLVDRLEDAIVREVRHLDGVDQREVRTFAGGDGDLQLRIELGPRQPLLLDTNAGLAREAIDELVHHLAVGAGEPVPVGDRRLRLRGAAARPRGRGGGRRGGDEECSASQRAAHAVLHDGWRWCGETLPQVLLHDHIGRRLVARVARFAHDAIATALVIGAQPRQRRPHAEPHT